MLELNLQYFGGRGASSGGGSESKYTDSTNFKEFYKINKDSLKDIGKKGGWDAVREEWIDTRLKTELKNVHEISSEKAIEQIRDSISTSTLDGWFRNADSEYKPRLIESILSNKGTLNAGLNVAYQNYKNSLGKNEKPLKFNKWLNTPQTLYRGDRGQKTVEGDIFMSYSLDINVAKKFGSNITKKRIKPIDTLGSYQTTGEQEYLIRVK